MQTASIKPEPKSPLQHSNKRKATEMDRPQVKKPMFFFGTGRKKVEDLDEGELQDYC
jgi:hypothetical protein